MCVCVCLWKLVVKNNIEDHINIQKTMNFWIKGIPRKHPLSHTPTINVNIGMPSRSFHCEVWLHYPPDSGRWTAWLHLIQPSLQKHMWPPAWPEANLRQFWFRCLTLTPRYKADNLALSFCLDIYLMRRLFKNQIERTKALKPKNCCKYTLRQT